MTKSGRTRAKVAGALPKAAAGSRVALFVEGTNELTPARRDDLSELWRCLCDRVGASTAHLSVHGFTKQQLVLMDPSSTVAVAGKIPLDALVARRYDEAPFDRLVVAFDALPANQGVLHLPGGSCLASERDFLLKGLSRSTVLPERFREPAKRLLQHYTQNRARPRSRSRPPLGDVEAIYMAPAFESLVMADASALREVFSLKTVPKAWPRMPYRGTRPDFAFGKIVDAHRADGPAFLRQRYRERKHAWAQEVVKRAKASSPLLTHEIAVRLGDLVR